jgi:hypothetical protein
MRQLSTQPARWCPTGFAPHGVIPRSSQRVIVGTNKDENGFSLSGVSGEGNLHQGYSIAKNFLD